MAVFIRSKRSRQRSWLRRLALFLLILALFAVAADRISADVQRRGEENLIRALSSAITECYAYEGHYPEDLDAVVKRYGLTWDQKSYYVDYRFLGGNVFPDFTVIRLN